MTRVFPTAQRVEIPETHYAKTDDGLSIAYQTVGDGPTDIVFVPFLNCVDLMWEEPSYAHALNRLARIGRLICLDLRGFGASDFVPLGALPTPEAWMDDVRIVLDAVASTTANLVCHGSTGAQAMLFAATYPERTNALVLIEATTRVLRGEDYSFGVPPDLVEWFVQTTVQGWGTGANVAVWAPSLAGDEAFRRWLARSERGAVSPATGRP